MTRHRLSCSLLALTLAAGLAQAAPQIPERLAKASKITYCGALDTPPIGFFDANQKPQGLTVDLGAEIAKRLEPGFGSGHLVLGPPVAALVDAGQSARAALAGFAVARAWRDAPRPVEADDLLPERALA